MTIRDHLFPTTLADAAEMLRENSGKGRIIAGGTDLVPEIRDQGYSFEVIVDLGHIPGLNEIRKENPWIHLGPMVTMTQAERSPLLKKEATALSQAASMVGGPQVRNRATLAGNIVSAQPAADGAIALLALDADLSILGPEGIRTLRLEEAYQGVGKSTIDPSHEILSLIKIPAQKVGQISVFSRKARRKAMALPELNCAIWLEADEGICHDVRIALGPVATQPLRAHQAEACLIGKPLLPEFVASCALAAKKEVSPRDSLLRGSAHYRKDMVAVLVQETIMAAIRDLGGSKE